MTSERTIRDEISRAHPDDGIDPAETMVRGRYPTSTTLRKFDPILDIVNIGSSIILLISLGAIVGTTA